MGSSVAPIVVANGDSNASVWAFRNTQVSSGSGGGVTRLIAGSNITLSPTTGLGDVTVSASGGGGGGVTSVTASPAGVGLSITPTTGAVVIRNTEPASRWSDYTATSAVNMNANNLNLVTDIGGVTSIQGNAGVDLSIVPATGRKVVISNGSLEMSNQNITNANDITAAGNISAGFGLSADTVSATGAITGQSLAVTGSITAGFGIVASVTAGTGATVTGTAQNPVINVDPVTLPNPILNAALGLNTTGTGSTTIGNTTGNTLSTGDLVIDQGCSLGSSLTVPSQNGSVSAPLNAVGAYSCITNQNRTATAAGGPFYAGLASGRIVYFNGTTFTNQATTQSWTGIIAPVDNNMATAYACCPAGIFKTTNTGALWSLLSSGLPPTANWTCIAGLSSGIVAASTNFGIWCSSDAGASFTQRSSLVANFSSVTIDSSNVVYACVSGGGLYKGSISAAITLVGSSPVGNWKNVAAINARFEPPFTSFSGCLMGRTDGTCYQYFVPFGFTEIPNSIGYIYPLCINTQLYTGAFVLLNPGFPIRYTYDTGINFVKASASTSKTFTCVPSVSTNTAAGNVLATNFYAGASDAVYRISLANTNNIEGMTVNITAARSITLNAGAAGDSAITGLGTVGGSGSIFLSNANAVYLPNLVYRVLPSNSNVSQPIITRGTATIASGASINFGQTYVFTPTVLITPTSSGVSSVPYVSSVSTTSFVITFTGIGSSESFAWVAFG